MEHPHIVALLDVYYTSNNCYIITEYCEGGSLQSLMDTQVHFDWARAAYQIGSACQYLAARCIVHRDIKPANVLISGSCYKLGDFGFALEFKASD